MGVFLSKKKNDKFNALDIYVVESREKLEIKEIRLQIKEDNLIKLNQKLQYAEEKLNILINELSVKTIQISNEFEI